MSGAHPGQPLIVGVGAALVDLLIEEGDAFIERLGTAKGGMTLVDLFTIEKALNDAGSQVAIVPGGSACNTLVGLGNLGGRARMIGRLGRDELGEAFLKGLEKAGVEGRLIASAMPTGRVLSVVTPDAQRTMYTYLGASSGLSPEDLRADHFAGAHTVLLEGYLLFNRPVVDRIVELARAAGARLALDLASFQVVEANRDYLDRLIPEAVDILLANEDEAKAYTGKGEEESLEAFAPMVDLAVVKLGKRGALLARGKERHRVPARVAEAVDTTGAGDLWAAGFLHGYSRGYPLPAAARLGAELGAEVVQVMGAVIPLEGWRRIHRVREELDRMAG